tara:strand:- start:742 stop:1005 length:264 start_codon:yes stop_codon:yes gene_type:complete
MAGKKGKREKFFYTRRELRRLFEERNGWYARELMLVLGDSLAPIHQPKLHRLQYILKIDYAKGNMQDGTLGHRESADYCTWWVKKND